MKFIFYPLALLLGSFFVLINTVIAQDIPARPTVISYGTYLGESLPLSDLPAITAEEYEQMKEKALLKAARKKIEPRLYPFAESALPKSPDAVWQKTMGSSSVSKAPIVNFEGQTTSSFPPDCNGTAGPNHYMQTVNTTYAIYNKSGTLLAGPTNMNLLFGSVAGATCNDGDPLIQYDEQADRWVAVEFSLCGSNDLMLIAVSTTNNPTGTWYQYSFDVADTPDYEKIGVWQDGYYMGTNTGSGNDIYVFERSKMLLGQAARMVAFDNAWRPGTGFLCVPPLDNDGTFAPAGSPGMFIAFNDDAVAGGSDQLWLYELAVNWTTPALSTFTRSQQIGVTPFDSQFTAAWNDITQPNSQKLDGVPQVIMNAPQYRNFGSYQTIVCCHTVDVDATNHAGIRWYELRKTPPATTWTIRQQGTFAPDAHSRWMGSIMLNGTGKLGLAYSISSSTVFPGIRYCGQSSSAYSGATGVLDISEQIIHTGSVAQTTYNRWGDYALLSVDPADDQTFWFTSEYVKTGGTTKGTKIASFKFGNDPVVVTQAATAVTGTSATLNGTVNPNGLACTYYFEYGATTSYGTPTTTTSAGSGSSAVAVTANISGLAVGQAVHFRLVATNSNGTSYGGDQTFYTAGAATVTTTAASAITQNTATSGGNVTSDGGSAVTARGVCWATTLNPVATGNHTTDGSGTGSFTSSITGLSSTTTYHVRAYATNANGTYYGDDLTFTTPCGVISTFPWNEGFSASGVMPSCWTQEQVNSSGLSWTFIAGNGTGYPASDHGGTYNACLKDITSATNKTKLITPVINLSSLISPQLKFWHTQAFWSPDQDTLIVFYKTSSGGTWTQLAKYSANLTAWTQETISLPNPGSTYYIAFEGNAVYGRGVCLDDVSITGTTPTLAVTPSNQNVTPLSGTTSFTVTSNTSWTVSSNQAWCTVTLSGTGNGTVTANYLLNNTALPRVANVTVTVNGLTPQVVTVTQGAPTLAVAPSNLVAPSTSGSNSFSVTSNTSWTAASDQSWCTVTPSGSGNGTITANYTSNATTTSRIANITVTVSGLAPVIVTLTQDAPVKVLNLTVLLEGLFNGTTMNKAKNATGDQFAGTIADQITLELHNSTAPYALAGGPYTINVNTDGTASVTVPATLGASYYLVVKHRNSIETWNASPVSFSGASMSYNFSNSAAQAFGNNLKQVAGKYVIFGGDVNQDGVVDADDLVAVDNDASNFMGGYLSHDANGDGSINAADIQLLNANANVFIVKIVP